MGMIASAEWKAWQGRPPKSTKGASDRLPPGWCVYEAFGGHDESLDLIRRDGGGWILLRWNKVGGPTITDADQWLVDLYAGYLAIDDLVTALGRQITRWLRQAIVDLYDPTDPEQAAARMLVALGADVVVEPAAPQLDRIT